MMQDVNQKKILSMVGELRQAPYFEDAARILLREMLGIAKTALEQESKAASVRILRGMIHLRPGDGYRRLSILETESKRTGPTINHVPSASAWRWVAKFESPICLDVAIGRVSILQDGVSKVVVDGGFSGTESMNRLTGRDVSHLYAFPLRSLRGTTEGMATVEVACPATTKLEFFLPAIADPLQVLAELAAPHLAMLPLRPTGEVPTDDLLPVIGAAMAPVVEMLRVFARQEETLLIGGPTGAGKSRLARWCHAQSSRRRGPFEVLDLLTVPEELQMAELCGWRKGAFTGAVKDTTGCVARAVRGTLFIDEIDKLSLKAQAGLLQLLEARTYRPLGDSSREQIADVRFIIGSNVDLHDVMQKGRFREDLYYRINVLPVQIPSLDERRDEIAKWAQFMALRRHRESVPEGTICMTIPAEKLLGDHAWPGNLRQLDNVVRRAYALALMTHVPTETNITLTEAQVGRALTYERGNARKSVVDLMRNAATAFVEEAERLADRGLGLDLDQSDAFRGVVLGTAVQRQGNRDAAFRLLGKAHQVQSRNHHKLLRRDLEKVEVLCKALGETGAFPFKELLDEET